MSTQRRRKSAHVYEKRRRGGEEDVEDEAVKDDQIETIKSDI
jgi:hypothetical protein